MTGISKSNSHPHQNCGVLFSPALGAKLDGVHVELASDVEVGAGGVGGVAHGMLVKSKNSSISGCAASRSSFTA